MDSYKHIFQKYNLSLGAKIGSGMEADVYAFGEEAVLKIYEGTLTFNELVILKEFYSLSADNLLPYKLPEIHSVFQEGDCIVTIENRLKGGPLAAVLEHLDERDLDEFSIKWELLNSILQSPYEGDYKLIHGDFCPNNLLMDSQNRAAALIDFDL